LAEAAETAAGLGLAFVGGVEVSVTWAGRTLHVVGLGVDPGHPGLAQGLARICEFRDWRAEEMGRRLARSGIEGAYAGARALSNGRLIGRTHFARFLVERNLVRSEREVFKRYLADGRPGHVPGQWATLDEAVTWIRASGGQAVIAHPARYRLTRTKLLKLIGAFRELGGQGIEVVCGSHSRDEAFNFARHAREQGLLAVTGSDFHGPQLHLHDQPWLDLGRLPSLPDGCTPIWHDWPDV
jgi:predicted metal-dependent phosphoesterase TrpH